MAIKKRKVGAPAGNQNRTGTGTAPASRTRSLRLPVTTWEALDSRADVEGVTANRLAGSLLAAALNQNAQNA